MKREEQKNLGSEEINVLTEKIIGCAYAVSNELGACFLEKVYENAMTIELEANGLTAESQKPISVQYRGKIVGEYFADLLVNDEIIVELKVAKSIDEAHIAQTINYLRACGKSCGLILNFGKPRVEVKRVVNRFKEAGV